MIAVIDNESTYGNTHLYKHIILIILPRKNAQYVAVSTYGGVGVGGLLWGGV